MPDLRIGTEVDISALGNLSAASKQVQNEVAALAARFIAAGQSAQDTESALRNLGYSAKETAAAMAQLGTTTAAAGAQVAAASTSVDAMTRAMANADVRIASSMAGAGQFGFALARVGAVSSTLAPILAAVFPAVAAIAFIDIIGNLVDKYEQWSNLGMETTKHMQDLNIAVEVQSEKIELENLKLENRIALLQGGIGADNKAAEAALETKIRFDELGKSIQDDLDKIDQLFLKGYGPLSELFGGRANVKALGEMLQPFERDYQLAVLKHDKQAQINILLKEQEALQQSITEESAKHIEKISVPTGPGGAGTTTLISGRAPDVEALAQMQAALQIIMNRKQEIYDLDEQTALGPLKDQLEAHNKLGDAIERIDEQNIRSIDQEIRKELEVIDKRERADEEYSRHLIEEGLREFEQYKANERAKEEAAARVFEVQERMATESARAILDTDAEQIHAIQEQGREKRESHEEELKQLKDVMNNLQLQKEATRDLFEFQIRQQEAARAAGTFGPQGSKGFDDSLNRQIALQRQLDDLMKQFNRDIQEVSKMSDSLDTSWRKFWDSMRNNISNFSTNFRVQMQSSINTVNDGITKAVTNWISYNKSFGASMRELGVEILNSFVSMFIKIGLQWLETQIMMKIAGKAIQTTSAVDRVISEAAVAGAGGVASMAAAPFPIDLTAPSFGAAMMAAALSFAPLAAAEKGGIVGGAEQLTLLHPSEMVLPRNISESVQRAASGGSMAGGPAGHTFNINYAPTINGNADSGTLAGHTRDLQKMIRAEARRLNLA